MKLPLSDNAFMFFVVVAFFSLAIVAFALDEYWLSALIVAIFLVLLYLDTRELRL